MRNKLTLADLLLLVALFPVIFPFWKGVSEVRNSGAASQVVYALEFSPDGKILARSTNDGFALFDIDTGNKLAVLDCSPYRVVFSADSKWLAYVTKDETVTIWDVKRRSVRRRVPHEFDWIRLALSPHGKWLAIAHSRTVQIWDIGRGELRAVFARNQPVHAMLFSPDGTILATATEGDYLGIDSGDQIELWDVESGKSSGTINGTGWLNALSFSADGSALLAVRSVFSHKLGGFSDYRVEFWDTSLHQHLQAEPEKTTFIPFADSNSLIFSTDGKRLAIANGPTVTIWNPETGQRAMTFSDDGRRVCTPGFSAKSQALLTADVVDSVNVWDLSTGRKLRTIGGLTLYAGEVPGLRVPWRIVPRGSLGAFFAWLALWLFVGYRKRAGSAEPRDLSRYLVVFAVLHAVGSGLLLLHVYCNSSTARDNTISFLIALAAVPLAVLAVLVVFKRFRSNWLFAVGSLLGVLAASGYTAIVLYLRAIAF